MKLSVGAALILMGVVGCTGAVQVQDGALTGTVERVWEDGFEVNTGDRTVRVDAWDLCGDNTQQSVSVGDELTVEGEFDDGEFDASAITNVNDDNICSAASAKGIISVAPAEFDAVIGVSDTR
ncbi:hypothetical protein [Vacuolonema iberomarrocanum]|uniref:hypothetical protein n=1 Tax=Vacuolonema iberomarrocanum TaxID=3454632 RepID=UPI001A06A9C7|nr:hypothetical protein [filamentous cyanobacterium LEGE 07170]